MPFDDDEIREVTFDEMARLDPSSPETHVRNAMNQLEFALHKLQTTEASIPIVNALQELEKFL